MYVGRMKHTLRENVELRRALAESGQKTWWLLRGNIKENSKTEEGRLLTSDEVIEWLRKVGPVEVRDGPRQGLNVTEVPTEEATELWWLQPADLE